MLFPSPRTLDPNFLKRTVPNSIWVTPTKVFNKRGSRQFLRLNAIGRVASWREGGRAKPRGRWYRLP